MKRGERDGRLRWAFGLAVLLHAGALAALAHLPLAQASSVSFDQITVFGADVPFSGSLVTLVDLPPSGATSPGPVVRAPETRGEERPAPRVKPPAPPHPEQHANLSPSRPETSEAPRRPDPAPHPPAAAEPAGAEGQGGPPAPAGTPNPDGTAPAPEGPVGVGEAPPGPAAGGRGGGGPTGTPETADGGQSGDGKSGTGEGPVGDPEGSPGTANSGPAKVEWANPKVLRATRPVYPAAAAANAVEGTVVMKVLVGERGQVVEAEVLRSSHDPRLDKAALTAVRQWRYEPATQNGKAHPVYTRATIRFKLR